MNAVNLPLEDGRRYHVCIYANETDLEFETFTQHLDAVSACSNGITVDLEPPTAGNVWIGDHRNHQFYQVPDIQTDDFLIGLNTRVQPPI